jgi:hypothetical protein
MNKTVYLREEEGPIWERARELAGEKLSPIIVKALKDFVIKTEAGRIPDMERIEISFNDSTSNNVPRKKAFYGRWIFPISKPFHDELELSTPRAKFALALTAKSNVVVFDWLENVDGDVAWDHEFRVFSSLEEVAADPHRNRVARAAIEQLGVPVEELDI